MTPTLVVPDAPPIAGLTFRTLAGVEDADALHAMHLGRAEHDRVDPLFSTESLPTRDGMVETLAAEVAAGQNDRRLLVEVAGRVVGYCHVESWLEDDGTWVYLSVGWLLPDWRGKGIGTAMLHWAESLSRRLAAAEHPGARAELAANASGTESEATRLLHEEGYTAPYTVLEMGLAAATPVTAAPLPAGLEIRPVAAAHLPAIAASVHEAYRDEFEGGRFSEDPGAAAYIAKLSSERQDPSLWQVAWEGEEVAGQVMSVIERGRGEVFEVSVRPAWRRRGLARSLLTRAVLALRGRGVAEIRLHTNTEFRTRARDLYASVGFRVLKEFPRYRKPLTAETGG